MSSAIASIFYDEDKKELTVSFVKGGVWVFHGVDSQTAEAFESAGSQGTFFNMQIRGQYSYGRVG